MSNRRVRRRLEFVPGEAQLPGDFGERLTAIKRRAGLDLGRDGRSAGRGRPPAACAGGAGPAPRAARCSR